MGPTEEGLELTAEEAENDERTHPAHLVDHRFVDILDAGKRFCCHAVGNTGQTEHDKEKGNEALKKRRPYKSMSVLRQDAREKANSQDGNIKDNDQTRTVKSFDFKFRNTAQFLISTGAFVFAKARLYDFDGNKGNHEGTEESRDKPQLQQLKTNSSSTYSSIPNDFQPHNYNW